MYKNRMYTCVFLSVLVDRFSITTAWKQWKYSSRATDEWKLLWGYGNGPRGRKGASAVVWNNTKILLFGGRDNDIHKPHVPKTYELVKSNEILTFANYDNMPLSENYDPMSCPPVVECFPLDNPTVDGNNETCSYSWHHIFENDNIQSSEINRMEEKCGFTTSGLIYNDLWIYDMACNRFSDDPCTDDGWKVLHPGMIHGGCRSKNDGDRVCEIPSERWNHGAAMIDESNMIVYGGYSQQCQDYCDDVWIFNLDEFAWSRIEFHHNIFSNTHPGKRWKFHLLSIQSFNQTISSVVAFGGHRHWHGFAPENSKENRWNSTQNIPKGGFLNDLWILSKIVSLEQNDTNTSKAVWTWSELTPKESCFKSPGISWEERNKIKCETFWPSVRSSYAAAYDKKRHGLWIHGGYAVHYPYPSSSSTGSGKGTKISYERGFIPFGTESYYREDLWFYNFTSGYWKEIFPADSRFPRKRMEHVMVIHEDTLILHGGFSEHMHYNDTWYYNIQNNTWLEKTFFVHAFFPRNCTDDVDRIQNDDTCVELTMPKPLMRESQDMNDGGYRNILPFFLQDGYTPSSEHPLYFGLVDDADTFVASLKEKYDSNQIFNEQGDRIWLVSDIPDGTPIAPHAATGPRQFAKKRSIPYNESLSLDIWEWCVSVKGEPNRGIRDLNINGNHSIRIPQPRRQSVGWDGCRELRWEYPESRSGHVAVFVEKYGKIVMYGGLSYSDANHETGIHPITSRKDISYNTFIRMDMWTYDINGCPKNCSNHGKCNNGFCECYPGYYGLDCSNITCPGSTCYYDENYEQHCTHCCFDGFEHTSENTKYLDGIQKIPCRALEEGGFTGTSHGICDGFGSCQCVHSFTGEDCSVRDCFNDCYGNGKCSIEFPNARCVCDPGFKGEYCQYKECLNNCSYPNGKCDHTKGNCICESMTLTSSRNRDDVQYQIQWSGDDCSYLYSASFPMPFISYVTVMMLSLSILWFTIS